MTNPRQIFCPRCKSKLAEVDQDDTFHLTNIGGLAADRWEPGMRTFSLKGLRMWERQIGCLNCCYWILLHVSKNRGRTKKIG